AARLRSLLQGNPAVAERRCAPLAGHVRGRASGPGRAEQPARRIQTDDAGSAGAVRVATLARLSFVAGAVEQNWVYGPRARGIESERCAGRLHERPAIAAAFRRYADARVLARVEREVSPSVGSHHAQLPDPTGHRPSVGVRGPEPVSR